MVKFEPLFFAVRRDTLILLVQNKVSKQKDTPCHGLRLPCATQQIRRLRNSLRSNSPRRKLLIRLRCSAWQQGVLLHKLSCCCALAKPSIKRLHALKQSDKTRCCALAKPSIKRCVCNFHEMFDPFTL